MAERCKAKSKRSGERCECFPMDGRDVCYMHGGKTPRGFASAQTKTGRWSKDLPTRLAARYEEAVADPNLLGLRNELALIDARLGELIASVDRGEAAEVWQQLRRARRDLATVPERDRGAILASMLSLIERGATEWQTWEAVMVAIERRTRVAESERKRLVEMQQTISAEQLNMLVAALVASIRQHVAEPKALQGISRDLTRLLSSNPAAH